MSLSIAEPTTTLTDFLLGAECLLLAWWLIREGRTSASRWMAGSLAATGVGALLGGVSHGFAPRLADTFTASLLWKATLLSIGLTAFLFLGSLARAALGQRARRWVLGIAGVQLVGYTVWITGHDAFVWAIVEFVPPMLIGALLALRLEFGTGGPAGPILAGIGLTFAGAGIQAAGFTLHRHFNHNDLFHVIQMVAVWLLYRGGAALPDAGSSGPLVETISGEP